MLKREDVFAYTADCYNGEPASCSFACPFRIDLRSVMKKAAKGKLAAAAKEIRQALPFPNTVSSLCTHPCEQYCQRCTVAGEVPVQIGKIEKACLATPAKKERSPFKAPLQPQRVAIVGAGAAGLCCALHLDRKRYAVTVFEKTETWGGSLKAHPEFESFEQEFSSVLGGTDVQFRFGEEISDLEQLTDYDAVCLCTGSGGETFGLGSFIDAALCSAESGKVFLCGECTGVSLLEGMAAAQTAARSLEAWLQSGDASYAKDSWDVSNCSRFVPQSSIEPAQPVEPTGELFTAEETQREAGRCLQCDCEACMKSCELLIKYKKKPPRIAQDVAQDGQTRNSVSSAAITRETWSCSLCGRCGNMCREGVDLSGLFELSRRDRVLSKEYPPAIHAYRMREYDLATGEASLLIPGGENRNCSVLFFPGCRLGGHNPSYVTETYRLLRKSCENAGLLLNCCGIPALWAGEGEKFDAQIAFLRETWLKLGKPIVAYACASCRKTFERFLPEIPLQPVYELLPPSNGGGAGEKLAVFDPCAAFGAEKLQEAVRSLALSSGAELTDYNSDGKCCGFGGHMQLANPGLYDEITQNRCQETEAPYLVYCVNCAEVFRKGGKSCRHILDLVLPQTSDSVPTLEEKRQNMLAVRHDLEREYLNAETEYVKQPWEFLKLQIEPAALEKMERKLVPAVDVQEAIWKSERAGDGFENAEGDILCRLPGPILTCWVKYRKEREAFCVLDVYVHRMHIREDEGE